MYSRHKKIDTSVSCFLFGLRGNGKTFWLRHCLPDSIYVDLLEARTSGELLADPQRLANLIPPDNRRPIVIEVTYLRANGMVPPSSQGGM